MGTDIISEEEGFELRRHWRRKRVADRGKKCARICSRREIFGSKTQQPISVTEPGAVLHEAGEAARGKITAGLGWWAMTLDVIFFLN